MNRVNLQVSLTSLLEDAAHTRLEMVARYRGMAEKIFAKEIVPLCYEKNFKLVAQKPHKFPIFYNCETNQVVSISELGEIHAMMVIETGLAELTHLACFMPEFDPTLKDVKVKMKNGGRVATVLGFELFSANNAPKAHIGGFKVKWDDLPSAVGWVSPDEFNVIKQR